MASGGKYRVGEWEEEEEELYTVTARRPSLQNLYKMLGQAKVRWLDVNRRVCYPTWIRCLQGLLDTFPKVMRDR